MMDDNIYNILSMMVNKSPSKPSTCFNRTIQAFFLSKQNLSHPILDLGCGDGFLGMLIFNLNKIRITFGIDIKHKSLIQASLRKEVKESYKNFIVSDAVDLPFCDNSIGSIFSNSTVEHIRNLDKLLYEIKRVLKYNGKFIFTVPSDKYAKLSYIYSISRPFFLSSCYDRLLNEASNHYHTYSLKEWRGILENAGFKSIKGFYYPSPYISKRLDLYHLFSYTGFSKFKIYIIVNKAVAAIKKISPRIYEIIEHCIYSQLEKLLQFELARDIKRNEGREIFIEAIK